MESAVAALGYVPNTLARGLRSKHTHTMALVMTDITNPFFTMIARGVQDAASNSGYSVIYCNTDESEEEEQKYINILVQKQVAVTGTGPCWTRDFEAGLPFGRMIVGTNGLTATDGGTVTVRVQANVKSR